MTIDLKQVSEKLKKSIDEASVELFADMPSWRLGASKINNDCKRALWYAFRWCHVEKPDARTLRLLNRGDREEANLLALLEKAGIEVLETQKPFSTHCGHFGGKCDAIIKLPESYGIAEPILASFKTIGTGKGFSALFDEGVEKAKPAHYAQECTYGMFFKIEYCAYFYANKNDDDLFVEVVKLNFATGLQMSGKAEIVIRSQTPPEKFSNNPNNPTCKYCNAKNLCHENAPSVKSCRSCTNAVPTDDAQWNCSFYQGVIPREFVEGWIKNTSSCENYKDISK